MIRRVLVVEDNAPSRELLTDWLEAQGYEVRSAVNLGEALEELRQHKPDAVLLDMQLGNENGLQVPAWMRKQEEYARVVVIAVTAHAMVAEQKEFLEAGCNACISKPVNFRLLQEQLDFWLSAQISAGKSF